MPMYVYPRVTHQAVCMCVVGSRRLRIVFVRVFVCRVLRVRPLVRVCVKPALKTPIQTRCIGHANISAVLQCLPIVSGQHVTGLSPFGEATYATHLWRCKELFACYQMCPTALPATRAYKEDARSTYF